MKQNKLNQPLGKHISFDGYRYDHLRAIYPNDNYDEKVIEIWTEYLANPDPTDKEHQVIRTAVLNLKASREGFKKV